MAIVSIITLVIYMLVAVFMIGIGISQLRSLSPVGFYTGEKAPAEEELTDVKAWNKKHGMMWLIYGGIILISYVCGYFVGDSVLSVIPLCGGLIVPIIFMIWYHNKLIKKYKKNERN